MGGLKKVLADEYGDDCVKNLDKGYPICIDDRTEDDIASDNSLYSYFCEILLFLISEHEVKISLRYNVPMSEDVKEWIANNNCDYADEKIEELTLILDKANINGLQDLAIHIKNIVKPGARYTIPNYKYVCPRTAKSLERFARVARKAWNT